MKNNIYDVALIQYVREKGLKIQNIDTGEMYRLKGALRGVLVADQVGNEIQIGWSYAHENDVFDKQRGINIAKSRMAKPCNPTMVPHKVRKEMEKFQERALKYFKVTV